MEHQFFKDRLSAYFDNELKNEELVIIQQHLDSCEECQKEIKQFELLDKLVAEKTALSENTYWEQSAQKIEAKIKVPQKTEVIKIEKKSSSLWWKLSGLAASLILVAFIAYEQKDTGYQMQNDTQEIATPTDSSLFLLEQDAEKSQLGTIEEREILPQADDAVKEEISHQSEKVSQPSSSDKTVTNLQSKPVPQSIPDASSRAKTKIAHSAESVQPPVQTADKDIANALQETAPQKTQEMNLDKSIDIPAETQPEPAKKESANIITKNKRTSPSTALSNSFQNVQPKADEPKKSVSQVEEQSDSTSDTNLAYWRRKVVEYTSSLESTQKSAVAYQKNGAGKSAKKESLIALDKDLLYKQLFEAHYYVATLTSDSLEESKSVDILTIYADSLTKSFAPSAMQYLQMYKNEKLKQNSTDKTND